MGLEYIADFKNTVSLTKLSDIMRDFISLPYWLVREHRENVISFMFSTSEPRPEGPEDFRIKIDSTQIYVVFYGGTRKDERNVLGSIETLLAAQGIEISLEEL